MKKSTILAASFVLAAAILAVWFAGERSGSEQGVAPIADAQLPSLPEVDDSVTEPRTSPTVAPVEVDALPQLPSTEPVRLFSSPDYGSIEYRNASDNAAQFLAEFRQPIAVRSQLLKKNQGAINEMVRQFESNSDGLSRVFDITPFADLPCLISSVDRTSPDFSPGFVPSRYSVETRCESSNTPVTVAVDKIEGYVSFGFRSPMYGGFSITTIDNSGYSVAYQLDPSAWSGNQ